MSGERPDREALAEVLWDSLSQPEPDPRQRCLAAADAVLALVAALPQGRDEADRATCGARIDLGPRIHAVCSLPVLHNGPHSDAAAPAPRDDTAPPATGEQGEGARWADLFGIDPDFTALGEPREGGAPFPMFGFEGCTDRNPEVCACATHEEVECAACGEVIEAGVLTYARQEALPWMDLDNPDQEWTTIWWHASCDSRSAAARSEAAGLRAEVQRLADLYESGQAETIIRRFVVRDIRAVLASPAPAPGDETP